MIAVVGSRNASAAGCKFAERIARELGDAGFIIVSGSGARHRRRRASRRASAAAPSRCWPAATITSIRPSTCRCCEQILPAGAAVTEMPLGWEPRGRDFPRRNRLISGLAIGVVIVEAARRSGSLITARMAAEQGREVFAVPGSPLDPRAEGTNGLLKQGATLVTEAADVLSVIRPILGQRIAQPVEEPDGGAPRLAEPGLRRARPHHRPARPRAGLASTTWCGCRNPRRRWCGRCCWNSNSPAGWSAMAAGWSRWCKLRAMIPRITRRHPVRRSARQPRAGATGQAEQRAVRAVRRRSLAGRPGQGHHARHLRCAPSTASRPIRRVIATTKKQPEYGKPAGLYINQIASPAQCRRGPQERGAVPCRVRRGREEIPGRALGHPRHLGHGDLLRRAEGQVGRHPLARHLGLREIPRSVFPRTSCWWR